MITHTITWLELAWTIAAIIGLIIMCMLISISIGDYKVLVRAGRNGYREYSARTGILLFIGGFITQSSYVFIGCIAMSFPSPSGRPTFVQYATGVVFFMASLIGIIIAGVVYFRRIKLIAMIEENEGNQGEK